VWRSLLYVPADRADQFVPKAEATAVDAIIVDLEDGVAPTAKAAARARVATVIRSIDRPVIVRVNSGDALDSDIEAIALADPSAVMLPKATALSLDDAERSLARHRLPVPVIALVESARGLLDLEAMARHRRVSRFALGEADLRADLGLGTHADHALWPLRTSVVVASAAHGLEPPIGPVSTDWRDLDDLRRTSTLLRNAGFGGRSAIHPDQVSTINDAFRPSADDVKVAERIVAIFDAALADGKGVAIDDNGRMIDEAVVRSARHVLS
jgi:citrate lyase subunit beta/citryl-CoA lyase